MTYNFLTEKDFDVYQKNTALHVQYQTWLNDHGHNDQKNVSI